jgi:hypothetical protein
VSEVVFPDAEDAPAGASKVAVDEFVAPFVGGKFLSPEGAVVDGEIGVFGTGVPKAAVHEEGEAGC